MFSYRIAPIQKIGKSPFELLYGRTPKTMIEIEELNDNTKLDLRTELEIFAGINELRKEFQEIAIN